ncbi:MAG: hypothetical protein OXC58_06855, partial [Acidimicrobiaceae bacterium]|nr:hypothetical protein [Acidimicrobiaceae bacterium]MCY4294540.1 hypothetical protein [Acidimicrobiaceae bacterium]
SEKLINVKLSQTTASQHQTERHRPLREADQRQTQPNNSQPTSSQTAQTAKYSFSLESSPICPDAKSALSQRPRVVGREEMWHGPGHPNAKRALGWDTASAGALRDEVRHAVHATPALYAGRLAASWAIGGKLGDWRQAGRLAASWAVGGIRHEVEFLRHAVHAAPAL